MVVPGGERQKALRCKRLGCSVNNGSWSAGWYGGFRLVVDGKGSCSIHFLIHLIII